MFFGCCFFSAVALYNSHYTTGRVATDSVKFSPPHLFCIKATFKFILMHLYYTVYPRRVEMMVETSKAYPTRHGSCFRECNVSRLPTGQHWVVVTQCARRRVWGWGRGSSCAPRWPRQKTIAGIERVLGVGGVDFGLDLVLFVSMKMLTKMLKIENPNSNDTEVGDCCGELSNHFELACHTAQPNASPPSIN